MYPAANHTRFEHVLGAMHLAGVLVESLPVELRPEDKQKLKLAALLHDVGHAAFSHLFEPLLTKYLGKSHEDMTTWAVTSTELADTLRAEGFDPDEMSTLAIGKHPNPPKPFFNQIIRSSVDVDKMDFVVRDSYHTGAGYGGVDIFRLIYTMDILDGNLAVDSTAISVLESFILARLESFQAIYFHRTSRAVQIMLLQALELAKDDLGIPKLKSIDEYLALDDYTAWQILLENKRSRPIIEAVQKRKLLKCAYEKTFFVHDEMISSVFTKESVRTKIEEEIAQNAKVPKEEISIDTPSLPTVPYHYAMEIDPTDIPVFSRTREGQKVVERITEISKLVETFRVFLNILRVYTKEEYRDRVNKAAADVFGEPTLSTRVSY